MKCIFISFTDNTKLHCRAWLPIRRLDKCANGNLMKFNKGKHMVLHLKNDKLMQKGLGADCIENSFAEKVQGV